MERRGGRPRLTGAPDRFAALADPTRRHLLSELAGGDRTVAELSAGLAISQPAVSQHLKVLRDAGLVLYNQAGRSRLYRLRLAGVSELSDWLLELEHRWHSATSPSGNKACDRCEPVVCGAADDADRALSGVDSRPARVADAAR
jgi:DNA-binding transcriptional ArsR family regulator